MFQNPNFFLEDILLFPAKLIVQLFTPPPIVIITSEFLLVRLFLFQ